jgi:hypothetical protein
MEAIGNSQGVIVVWSSTVQVDCERTSTTTRSSAPVDPDCAPEAITHAGVPW